MSNFEKVEALIAEQQKGKEGTAPWMVGEQLKDIARAEPAAAEARAKIEELQKKLLTASPALAQFDIYFGQLQEVLQKCEKCIAEIRSSDDATAAKLTAAMKAVCGPFAG